MVRVPSTTSQPFGPPKLWTPQSDRDLVLALKVKGEADLYTFCHTVCGFGMNPNPKGPKLTEEQRVYCTFLEQSKKPIKLILGARGSLKSTVLQGHALRKVSYQPDSERVLLYGQNHEQAKKRLAVLKRIIQHRDLYRLLFGEQDGSKKGYPWNEEMIMLASKTQHASREANIETAGVDVVVNARHFSAIYIDDIHSETNTNSKEQIDAVEEKFHLLMPLLDQGGEIIMAGVFWNDQDLHNRLLDNKDLRDQVDVLIASAYVEPDDPGETGTLRFPSVLTQKHLALQRGIMRTDLFACHYLLNPVPKTSAAFKREWFPVIPRRSAALIQTLFLGDPAGDPTATVSKRDSDYYGMLVVGVTEALDLLILDAVRLRGSPTEAIEQALVLIGRHRPTILGIERTGLGNWGFYLRDALRARGWFAVVEDLLPGGRTKLQRVLGMEPYARRRKVFVSDEAQGMDDFFAELERVTFEGIKAKHDDLIDPFGYIPDLLKLYPMGGGQDEPEPWEARVATLDPLSQGVWQLEHARRDKPKHQGLGEFV